MGTLGMVSVPALDSDAKLQCLVEDAIAGKPAARELLLDHAGDRLLRMTRAMFHDFPALQRWEQTDDVFQDAMIRLHRALAAVEVQSVAHFFNLAGVQIRRTLLDLVKHHLGPEGAAANHHTDHQPADDNGGTLRKVGEQPDDIEAWTEFHERVGKLPLDEQEVVNLLFYEGLQQEQAAAVLGISYSTLKRRWQAARLRLQGIDT
jgi:RNA polymerase sigma-70 factor (ECF subfamily)